MFQIAVLQVWKKNWQLLLADRYHTPFLMLPEEWMNRLDSNTQIAVCLKIVQE